MIICIIGTLYYLYCRDLSAVCNSKINPAFAQIGGKCLNAIFGFCNKERKHGLHPRKAFLQELHRVQVKHLVEPDHLEELRPTKQHLGELTPLGRIKFSIFCAP